MNKIIQNLLRLDLMDIPQDYEMMLFGMWARWCESVTTNEIEYQKVLSNPAVNAWYRMELSKLQIKFVKECTTSSKASYELIRECYNDITFELFNYHPKALLVEAKKRELSGYTGLHGIRIVSKISNLN